MFPAYVNVMPLRFATSIRTGDVRDRRSGDTPFRNTRCLQSQCSAWTNTVQGGGPEGQPPRLNRPRRQYHHDRDSAKISVMCRFRNSISKISRVQRGGNEQTGATMKKTFLVMLALTAVVAKSANAADVPVKAPPKAPPVEVYDWSGIYIGAGLGGGWTEPHRFYPNLPEVGIPRATFESHDQTPSTTFMAERSGSSVDGWSVSKATMSPALIR